MKKLFLTAAFMMMGSSFHVKAADAADPNLLGVMDYKGGFVETLQLKLAKPLPLKYIQFAVPSFCNADMSKIRVSSGGRNPVEVKLQDKANRVYAVNAGRALDVDTIEATVNGPDNLVCHIPVSIYDYKTLREGYWTNTFRWSSTNYWEESVQKFYSDGRCSASDGLMCTWSLTGDKFHLQFQPLGYNAVYDGTFDGTDTVTGTMYDPKSGISGWFKLKFTSGFQPPFHLNDIVEIAANSSLYNEGRAVGSIAKGQLVRIIALHNEWAAIQFVDGRSIGGWIQLSNLKKPATSP